MSTTTTDKRYGTYDYAERRKAQRAGQEKGCRIYIPAPVLIAAGIDPDGPPPRYRLHGFQRSKHGHTVIATLYVEA